MTRPVIIGAGLAGLSCALAMAPRPVVVLGRQISRELTSSVLAQGGIAAAVGEDDSPDNHIRDTIMAGAGLCNDSIVRTIVGRASWAIEKLVALGVPFDREPDGSLALSREAAHNRRRVVHAQGAATGAAIMRALLARVRETPSIMMVEGAEATELMTREEAVCGVVFRKGGQAYEIATDQVVLATGSACALWRRATVPGLSWGHGLALAARAGAALRDLEFVQFHPTALDVGGDPLSLLSEALRGEGAVLVNETGARFVDEMATRDVVARAIGAERSKGRRIFLDARGLSHFAHAFPALTETCRAAGIDPAVDLLPVCPVAHYHMGGVATDGQGKTTVPGLWACGEGACTGLHGANRLASNSLLEAFVMGGRVAESLTDSGSHVTFKERGAFLPGTDPGDVVRDLMDTSLGLVRDDQGMALAVQKLTALAEGSEKAFVALMIAQASLMRRESRGGHFRADFPQADPAQARSLFVTWREGRVCIGEENNVGLSSGSDRRAAGARRFA